MTIVTKNIKDVDELITEQDANPVYDAKGKAITNVSTDPDIATSVVNNETLQSKSLSYPFAKKALLNKNSDDPLQFTQKEAKEFLLDIRIAGTKLQNSDYSIGVVDKSPSKRQINLYSLTPLEVVARFDSTNPYAGIQTHILSEMGGSGISGEVICNWDALSDGLRKNMTLSYELSDDIWGYDRGTFVKSMKTIVDNINERTGIVEGSKLGSSVGKAILKGNPDTLTSESHVSVFSITDNPGGLATDVSAYPRKTKVSRTISVKNVIFDKIGIYVMPLNKSDILDGDMKVVAWINKNKVSEAIIANSEIKKVEGFDPNSFVNRSEMELVVDLDGIFEINIGDEITIGWEYRGSTGLSFVFQNENAEDFIDSQFKVSDDPDYLDNIDLEATFFSSAHRVPFVLRSSQYEHGITSEQKDSLLENDEIFMSESFKVNAQFKGLKPRVEDLVCYTTKDRQYVDVDWIAYGAKAHAAQATLRNDIIFDTLAIFLLPISGQSIDGDVYVKMWVNDQVVFTTTIPNTEVYNLPYNSINTALKDNRYLIELDTLMVAKAGDVVSVGWENTGVNKMAELFIPVNSHDPELLDLGDFDPKYLFKSDVSNIIRDAATPPQKTTGTYSTIFDLVKTSYGASTKIIPETALPKKIYISCNDTVDNWYGGFQLATNLYLDKLLNLEDPSLNDIRFLPTKSDKLPFAPYIKENNPTGMDFNHGLNIYKENITVKTESSVYDVSFPLELVASKASLAENQKIRLLCIGDSQTAGVGADELDNIYALRYSMKIEEFFIKHKVDNGNSGFDFLNIGHSGVRTRTFEYKGTEQIISASGNEGFGGWNLVDFLRHSSKLYFNQSAWDLKGLGDGSGSDYTDSQVQREAFAATNEGQLSPTLTGVLYEYLGLGNASALDDSISASEKTEITNKCTDRLNSPSNPFFDRYKPGSNRFSLTKYLERYRTILSDRSTRAVVGSTAGAEVTNVDFYNVCEPTHITLKFSENEWPYNSNDLYVAYLNELVSEIKAFDSNITVGLLSSGAPGTLFPELYPEVYNNGVRGIFATYNDRNWKQNKALIDSHYNGGDTEDVDKVYYIPTFFTMPTAYGFADRIIPAGEDEYIGGGIREVWERYGGNTHPGATSHAAWAQQVFAWLMYTCSL